MSRFADNIIILCRTQEQANRIIQAVMEFLSERGLKLNHEKSYIICESWLSQGYDLKAVHLKERRVVFRRTVTGMSGLKIPQELTRGKLPDAAVYEAERFFAYLIRRFGLSKKYTIPDWSLGQSGIVRMSSRTRFRWA